MQLITDEYRRLNEKLHEQNKEYGNGGHKQLNDVLSLARMLDTEDILDYGCGKSMLANSLPFIIKQYDPAIQKYNVLPDPADLVVCTDVLEHIEPECINSVLDHIRRLTNKLAYLNIYLNPAIKTLPDGRNAHLIVQPPKAWINMLYEYFNIVNFKCDDKSITVVVTPLKGGV